MTVPTADVSLTVVPETGSRPVSKALQKARDQIRKDYLLEVLLTYADTLEKMDLVRTHVRTMTVEDYAATLYKGLRDGNWPWAPR